MDEQNFFDRIRESALKQEAQTEIPLWDKKATWNRIESGLGKQDRKVWWKVAATILLILSLGFSYAQWQSFNRYKAAKELELSEMKSKVEGLATDLKSIKLEIRSELRQKYAEIGFLKNRQSKAKSIANNENDKKATVAAKNPTAAGDVEKANIQIIDSLKTEINKLIAAKQQTQPALVPESKEVKKPTIDSTEIQPAAERRIFYITNHFQPQKPKEQKSIRLNILEPQESQNIQYQSDYSIFKK